VMAVGGIVKRSSAMVSIAAQGHHRQGPWP
jgi:hypothetical protein